MTPRQQAVGEVFFGIMETFLGQHRSDWSVCDVERLEHSAKIRCDCVSRDGNLSVSIWVKSNGDVPSIKVHPSGSFKIHFLVQSVRIALEVLRHVK